MTSKLYGATGITGGTDGTVDSIVYSTLNDGDIAFAVDSNEDFVVFRFESSSSTSESSPWTTNKVIEPASFESADGRWVLADFICDELTTYGNATVNGNVDITGTLTFDAAGPAITVIKDEDTMTSDSATALATQQSIKAYVDNVAAGIGIDALAGYVKRPIFSYSSSSAITLNGFRYHHNGSSEQILKNDTTITFTFGSGGSNSNSSALGTSQWHYLYIDDSAVVTAASTTVSASELLNSTVAPSWDADQLGWYGDGTGNTQVTDRCIACFYVNSSGNIDIFYHDGGEVISWDSYVTVFSSLTTSYAAKTFRLPALGIGQRADATFYVSQKDHEVYARQHSSDQIISTGRYDNSGDNQSRGKNTMTRLYITDSSNQVDFKDTTTSNTEYLYQLNYYLPQGM